MEVFQSWLLTPIGPLQLTTGPDALLALAFVESTEGLEYATELDQPLARRAASQLTQYFEGELTQFDLPLKPEGTEFQQRVWQLLSTIPYGETRSYLDMARQLGDEKCIRAAAAANGKNPIAILIPCHRVIGRDGSLTGYAGGLHRKKWLLEREGKAKQGSFF